MAKIPGNTIAQTSIRSPGTVQLARSTNIGADSAALGGAISQVGNQIQEQRDTIARSKAAQGLTDYQLTVGTLADDFKKQIADGTVPYEQARAKFDEAINKIPPQQFSGIDPVSAEAIKKGTQRITQQAQLSVDEHVGIARTRDYRSQGVQQLDSLGKLAGIPNADVEQINTRADNLRGLLKLGGLHDEQISKALQDFKDANWFNQATQRVMLGKDSMQTLKKLEHDLTAEDGYYATRLDPQKRNQVLNQVLTHQTQLENRAIQAQAKRDNSAARVLNEIDRQIASGVPATPQMWADWGNKTKGTEFEQDFNDRVADEHEVQNMLRLPMDQQLKYVQDKKAALMTGGGSVREATNLARLSTAVDQNVKLLQESPLQFNANRLGADVQPLDFNGLLNGDGSTQAQIRDRVVTLGAMRKQYGDQVPLKPLLPQEAGVLSGILKNASPKEQGQVFASLYQAIGDATAYKAAMQQIAPDAPVKAMAGMLMANQSELTTKTHWFKPNEIKYSGDVAATLLQGESMLNASKDDKATDGKTSAKLYLPESVTLQADFQDKVGAAFTGRPEAAQVAFQAIKAYYVGRAAQTGRLAANSKDIDTDLVQEAITATMGSVVDFNGNGEVFAPWGMDRTTFINKATAAMVAEGKRQGLGEQQLNAFGESGLRQASGNTYYVVQGRNFVTGKDGKPITVTVAP